MQAYSLISLRRYCCIIKNGKEVENVTFSDYANRERINAVDTIIVGYLCHVSALITSFDVTIQISNLELPFDQQT